MMKSENYKESKYWDLNISLKNLLDNNTDCRLVVDYEAHKSDDCYDRIILLFKHPSHNPDEYCIEVGICEDGYVFVGSCNRHENYKTVPKRVGMQILKTWGEFLDARSNFESEIIKHVEEDCINIIFDNNYNLSHKYNKALTLRNKDEYTNRKEVPYKELSVMLKSLLQYKITDMGYDITITDAKAQQFSIQEYKHPHLQFNVYYKNNKTGVMLEAGTVTPESEYLNSIDTMDYLKKIVEDIYRYMIKN